MESRFKITTRSSPPSDRIPASSPPSDDSRRGGRNVFNLLARREISPRTKHIPKRNWGEASKRKTGSSSASQSEAARDSKRALLSWVEAESLRHLSAKYCPLMPPPRSTIAAAFSPDGRTLASTHGDHTVKIIDCLTGNCLKILNGHRRTPWVVRFHPSCPEIVASGSLDHEVRLWNTNTSRCIKFCDFRRPIASVAFHAKGELLAVASGHKLYIWNYIDKAAPAVILETRRSLRAVHFHPHAIPLLLTAEVNDLDSSDSSMTRATSLGYLRYPPPAVFVANFHSADRISFAADLAYSPLFSLPTWDLNRLVTRIEQQEILQNAGSDRTQVGSSASIPIQPDANMLELQYHSTASHKETLPSLPHGSHPGAGGTTNSSFPSDPVMLDSMETDEMDLVGRINHGSLNDPNALILSGDQESANNQNHLRFADFGQVHPTLPFGDGAYWELPFLQGWRMGQSQAGPSSMPSLNGGNREYSAQFTSSSSSNMPNHSMDSMISSLAMPSGTNQPGIAGRSPMQHSFANLFAVPVSNNISAPVSLHESGNPQSIINRVQSELATSLAGAPAAELPCTVRLRVWSHDTKNPSASLSAERCRLTITHAVLCSEMGAHFSPCGRFLAACVACTLPQMEADSGLQTLIHHDPAAATSPTRHPISAHEVMYELRIYSLEERSFGSVLVSRAIRAAHCLTSIQFSPTSEHILLAYGRRHGSLLKSIVVDGESTLPIYTVLEVYRVADMELVRVLPSAEDEVNVACFHPFSGCGLVYGTKEGKLRVLQYEGAYGEHCSRPN